jgi:ligand-binding sensor domain-containing protein
MKMKFLSLISLIFLVSCEKEVFTSEDNFSSKINFDVSSWILKDKDISCVDFDKDGNAWIGAGEEIIRYEAGNNKSFHVGSGIQDISVAKDGTVWIGTRDKGLAKFNG